MPDDRNHFADEEAAIQRAAEALRDALSVAQEMVRAYQLPAAHAVIYEGRKRKCEAIVRRLLSISWFDRL